MYVCTDFAFHDIHESRKVLLFFSVRTPHETKDTNNLSADKDFNKWNLLIQELVSDMA
jgi:hypothetical protein